jgi:hypothetical protein
LHELSTHPVANDAAEFCLFGNFFLSRSYDYPKIVSGQFLNNVVQYLQTAGIDLLSIVNDNDDGMLFSCGVQKRSANVSYNALLEGCQAVAGSVAVTATFEAHNDYARRHGLDTEPIPADPDGPVTISRFRRTIAWHIPACPAAGSPLTIQYGHLRTITTSEGYSERARHGLRAVLDIETARAMADYLHQLRDRLDHGEAISGPAAQRMLRAASAAGTRFEGMFLVPPAGPRPAHRPRTAGPRQPARFPGLQLRPGQGPVPPRPRRRASGRPPQPGPV